ncbi:hypothetical protein FM125_06395 [Micrococcus lylae]|uniref:Uncharacterized protein n=1 Tax=Micrococcus lylae TaxID=1273 RepID=A0A1R4J454_9MICC|nr:hypothetical protein [Micrococcus lylae]SJN26827.1 hypothetical protein FM125_06395 [Micrococcus lylae]
MTRIAAETITIDQAVETICIEAWDTEGGQAQGIIWDRTGQDDQDGEWGTQLIDWEGDLDDAVIAVEAAGFTVEEFVGHDIDGGGATALARR